MPASIEIVVALPRGTTATLNLDPSFMFLCELHTDGTRGYVPAASVKNLILYEVDPLTDWGTVDFIVAGVISLMPSDNPPTPPSVVPETYPSWCLCAQTTDITSLIYFTES